MKTTNMSLGPASTTRSGYRTLGYLAGSAALLLGTWLALRDTTPAPPPAVEEPVATVASASPPPENLDTSRRVFAQLDGDEYRVAAAGIPADVVEARLAARRDRPDPSPPDPGVVAANQAHDAAYPIATQALADELVSRRSALGRACWKKGGPPSATLYVMTTFGPDGHLREHSVGDDGTIPGLADCVRSQLTSLRIDAPGVELTTRAKLELP